MPLVYLPQDSKIGGIEKPHACLEDGATGRIVDGPASIVAGRLIEDPARGCDEGQGANYASTIQEPGRRPPPRAQALVTPHWFDSLTLGCLENSPPWLARLYWSIG